MKQLNGIWFPDGDTHFGYQLEHNPLVKGKGTYQFRKYKAAMDILPVQHRIHAVDIGSHVGLWARLMAHNFTKVTCFEPLPDHHECWEANMAEFDNVTLHKTALGAEEGFLEILEPTDHTGHSHVRGEDELARVEDVVVQVPMAPLDNFELDPISFLKIDVEGFETNVVRGAMKTIRQDRPLIVIEQKPKGDAERYGFKRTEALSILTGMGAKVYWEIGGDFCLGW